MKRTYLIFFLTFLSSVEETLGKEELGRWIPFLSIKCSPLNSKKCFRHARYVQRRIRFQGTFDSNFSWINAEGPSSRGKTSTIGFIKRKLFKKSNLASRFHQNLQKLTTDKKKSQYFFWGFLKSTKSSRNREELYNDIRGYLGRNSVDYVLANSWEPISVPWYIANEGKNCISRKDWLQFNRLSYPKLSDKGISLIFPEWVFLLFSSERFCIKKSS